MVVPWIETLAPRRRLVLLLGAAFFGLAAWLTELQVAPASIGLFPWVSLFLIPAWWLLIAEPRQVHKDLVRVPFWFLVFVGIGYLATVRAGTDPRWARLPLYALVQLGTLGPLLLLRNTWVARLDRRPHQPARWVRALRQLGIELLLVTLWLPVIMLAVNLHRSQGTRPTPAGAAAFEFAGAGGTRLAGLWLEHPRARGAVLMVHGIGAEKVQFLVAVRSLVDQGFSVLTYDQRNHGASNGLTVTLGLVESADVRAAWAQLLARTQGRDIPRLLFGISLGGAAAQLAAPDLPELDGLILDSTFARAADIAARAVPIPWLGEQTLGLARLVDVLVVGHDVIDLAPIEAAARLDPAVPVLILHARGDPLIPFDQALLLLQAYGRRAALQAFPGRHHARGFANAPEDYFQALDRFAARLPSAIPDAMVPRP